MQPAPSALVATPPPSAGGRAAPDGVAARVARDPLVAVLPFIDLDDAAGDSHLGDAVSEDLSAALSRYSGILVTGWESCLACRPFAHDIPRVARRLGVGHVVDGAVSRADGRLRLTVRLVDGATGEPVLTDALVGSVAEILMAPEELARRIAGRLAPQRGGLDPLRPGPRRRRASRRATSSSAPAPRSGAASTATMAPPSRTGSRSPRQRRRASRAMPKPIASSPGAIASAASSAASHRKPRPTTPRRRRRRYASASSTR